MVEATRETAPSTLFGKKSESPSSPEIPFHHRSQTILKIESEEGNQGKLWNERGNFIEERVKSIISVLPNVDQVVRHEHGSKEDMDGHDLTVTFKEDSPVEKVYVQVKSSRQGIIDYKRQLRDRLPAEDRWNMELVKEWLTNNNIILLNGGETKSNADVVESFYPQLERIKQKALTERNVPIQVFPQLQPA